MIVSGVRGLCGCRGPLLLLVLLNLWRGSRELFQPARGPPLCASTMLTSVVGHSVWRAQLPSPLWKKPFTSLLVALASDPSFWIPTGKILLPRWHLWPAVLGGSWELTLGLRRHLHSTLASAPAPIVILASHIPSVGLSFPSGKGEWWARSLLFKPGSSNRWTNPLKIFFKFHFYFIDNLKKMDVNIFWLGWLVTLYLGMDIRF